MVRVNGEGRSPLIVFPLGTVPVPPVRVGLEEVVDDDDPLAAMGGMLVILALIE